ncbi:Werner syndrome ATP-dependent helicase [Colletotrichum chlorophyti]|uniref:Werner syndrome ATP-dependent helicase n=1 Tax=Colletotrichum chlorophyti TaxID=708187 RepID=A0A1Q8RKY2_9PEZI|nr:Werner syndrome ATP-dependent helicase [Colletotrichum chlorophyti]
MYPSSYGKLWNPKHHGIVFASAGHEETARPRVDMLRSLHTTTPSPGQTAASLKMEHEAVDSDTDDAPFSTAPEYQIEIDEKTPVGSSATNGNSVGDKIGVSEESQENVEPARPPLTYLDFNVSLKSFYEAQSAPEGSAQSFWSYSLYRGPEVADGAKQKVKVHYCKSKHTMERVCQYFLNDKVLGFDLEWFPEANRYSGPKKNVSLIQIANESRIALFHVSLFPESTDFVARTFRKIMEDSQVRKVGVAIKGDCTRLRTHMAVDTKGVFELSHLHKLVKYSADGQVHLINKRLVPLATLVKEHLGLPMFKGQDVRSSDWSRALNMDQISYSASDAYAGFQLYHVLEKKRGDLDPTPPRPYDAELNLPIRLAEGVVPQTTEADEDAEADVKEALRTAPIQFEPDAEGESIAESIQAAQGFTSRPKRAARDTRITIADELVARYRASIKSLRATPSAVRSYFIWMNNRDLNPEAIAKILREPPLQTNTVVSYILEAIKLEKLPYDKKRLRTEILDLLPEEVLQGRYGALMREASHE